MSSDDNEEKAGGPDETIQTIINKLIKDQLPTYVNGKNNKDYREEYYNKHFKDMEKDASIIGGKTQKKNKRKRTTMRQRTIKNKARY